MTPSPPHGGPPSRHGRLPPRHGGNLREIAARSSQRPSDLLDFSANLNPLGPPEWLRAVVNARLSEVAHYPDPDANELVQAIADRFHVAPDEVAVGNGSAELLAFLPLVVHARRALIPVPAYVDYRSSAEALGLAVETVPLAPEHGFRLDFKHLETRLQDGDLVLLGRPNNPTGLSWNAEALRRIAARWTTTTFVVDEAFADFVEGFETLADGRPPNVVVLRSFTKFYCIPGLRLGCMMADRQIVGRMWARLPPWSVNALAQAVGTELLRDNGEYAERSRSLVATERRWLLNELSSIGDLVALPGEANFLLIRLERRDLDATGLAGSMLRSGVAIRACTNFEGLDARYVRVAVRSRSENVALCRALRSALGYRVATPPRRVPALMFQGTDCGAGKSLLAAALCRILVEDGYRVAPFKAQNTSLNSYVTRDGCEMGRAQAVQAQAARLAPDVRMNPILLKPSSDPEAQVLLMGKPIGPMNDEEYVRYKPQAFEQALAAYASLAAEHEVMVLEGVGSPAEVNLKQHDIANMRMAREAGAKVVIVGDIDRGGVFAALAGTFDALNEWERRMVFGFVVNRFRGEARLLESALAWTLRATGRPVLGVVPFLRDHGLPEEDSLGLALDCPLVRHDTERALQRLAEAVRARVDVKAIYREIGLA